MASNPRDVNARLSMDTKAYEAGAERASLATKRMLREQEAADRKYRAMASAQGAAIREDEARQRAAADAIAAAEKRKQAAYQATGRALVVTSGAILAGLGAATKAAMDWESAWAGVLKTVDGSTFQLVKLEQDLRALTRVLPATHSEIAAVAELAGQLGVHVDDVADFTRVMLDLGETTNLSAEDAATALARFSNVMGTARRDTDRMGSTIVALGNNSATTEAEIVALASRLAAAGRQAGLTEANVFAIASSLSSVGVEAEAGGTAVSKLFTTMNDAVIDGGDKLEVFARVAGMTVEDFATLFREDGAAAIIEWIEGMGRIAAAGESTTQIYADLGLTNERLKRSVGSLAAAGELLSDQVALANQAWAENNALLLEAAKRYETTESRLQIARNSLNDAAITIGDAFLPALADAADGAANLAQWFADLDPHTQGMIARLSGLAATGGLVAGAFLLLTPRLAETYRLIKKMRTDAPRLATGLGRVGKAAGALAIAVVAAEGVKALADAAGLLADTDTAGVETTTRALLDFIDAGADLDELFKDFDGGYSFSGIEEAFAWLHNPNLWDRMNDFAGEVLSGGQSDGSFGRTAVHNQIREIGTALSLMVQSGDGDRAAEMFDRLSVAWEAGGGTLEGLRALMPDYVQALAAAETEQESTASSAQELAESMGYVGEMSEETAKALESWREMVADADFISLTDAFDAVIEKNRQLAEEAADATSDTSDTWEDFIDDFGVSVDDYIAELERQVAAQEEWESNILALAARASELPQGMQEAAGELIDELTSMGPAGAEQVALFRSMSDEELQRVVELWGNKGKSATEQFTAELEAIRNPVIDVDANLEPARRDVADWVDELQRVRVSIPISNSAPIARATGGRLPGPPSSKDNMLIRAASGEYVVNAAATARNLDLLEAINSGKTIDVPGYATGGRVGWARRQTSRARDAYRAAAAELRDAQKAQEAARRSRDDRARDEASKRVTRVRKAEQAAREELREAKARQERLTEAEREVKVDVRRGVTVDRVTSGLSGAYSVIDEMLDASRNPDLSKKQRTALKKAARDAERELTRLYGQAEKVEAKLAEARDNVAELSQIAGAVASALQSEQSLRAAITPATEDTWVERTDGRGNVWHEQVAGTAASVTSRDLVAGARERAAKIRAFAQKLKKLADLGASGVILQEIAMLGSEEGSLVADALIAGGKAEVSALNRAYEDIKRFSEDAGQYVTEGFAKGGLAAAEEFVAELEARQERINAAIAKAGEGIANEFLSALGLKVNKKGKVVRKFAGGFIDGPGTATSDSVPAMLSRGEFVVNASATARNRELLEQINRGNHAPLYPQVIVQPAPVTVTTVLDAGSLARALDGAALTIEVDGEPVRGVVRAELADVAASARYVSAGG